MKTIISNLKFLLLIVTIIGFMSCEGEMGPAGPTGADGIDGTDGTDGIDGIDGTDGIDGNANVQTYIFNNPVWTSANYYMDIAMPDVLTDSVIKKDVILGYIKTVGSTMVNQIPGIVYGSKDYRVYIFGGASNIYRIVSYELDGTPTPTDLLRTIEWVKIVIIPSTNTTYSDGNSKNINPKTQILNELEKAGVDIANYNEVCDYYGLYY
jgi:hypothetical protein